MRVLSIFISPDVGSQRRRSNLTIVDLPQPEDPTTPTLQPTPTLKLTSLRTILLLFLYLNETFLKEILPFIPSFIFFSPAFVCSCYSSSKSNISNSFPAFTLSILKSGRLFALFPATIPAKSTKNTAEKVFVISKLLSLINKADRKNIKPYATNNIRYDSPNKNPIPAFFRNWSL